MVVPTDPVPIPKYFASQNFEEGDHMLTPSSPINRRGILLEFSPPPPILSSRVRTKLLKEAEEKVLSVEKTLNFTSDKENNGPSKNRNGVMFEISPPRSLSRQTHTDNLKKIGNISGEMNSNLLKNHAEKQKQFQRDDFISRLTATAISEFSHTLPPAISRQFRIDGSIKKMSNINGVETNIPLLKNSEEMKIQTERDGKRNVKKKNSISRLPATTVLEISPPSKKTIEMEKEQSSLNNLSSSSSRTSPSNPEPGKIAERKGSLQSAPTAGGGILKARKARKGQAQRTIKKKVNFFSSPPSTNISLDQKEHSSGASCFDKKPFCSTFKDISSSSLSFSPPKHVTSGTKKEEQVVPILTLGNYQESIHIDFGEFNVVGRSISRVFRIERTKYCHNDATEVEVEFIPSRKGFSLMNNKSKQETFLKGSCIKIESGLFFEFNVNWIPVKMGGIREVLYFRPKKRGRLTVTLQGFARCKSAAVSGGKKTLSYSKLQRSSISGINYIPKINPPVKAGSIASCKRELSVSTNSSKNPSGNNITSRRSSSIPKSSSSTADHQLLAYTIWLNHFISPSFDSVNNIHIKRAAFSVYNSYKFTQIRKTIEVEVQCQHLSIRSDRDLHSDLGLRKKALGLLFSYHLQWLSVALEIMLKEKIIMDSKKEDTTKRVLKTLILNRILSDPDIVQKYTGRGRVKTPSGKFEQQMKLDLRKHILKKFLTLVFFFRYSDIILLIQTFTQAKFV
mmetsp:Transcript_14617/g.32227  ORF Transcript_14617/g.32227 Transcript_14617/m.32227 type:complete len:736 (-) Transcript_14617:5041-7248(-)